MNYIYGYQNKITGKWYVGQTSKSMEERHRLHLSSAYHETCNDYNCLFHKKIREYGIENFELVLLEQVIDKSLLDDILPEFLHWKTFDGYLDSLHYFFFVGRQLLNYIRCL